MSVGYFVSLTASVNYSSVMLSWIIMVNVTFPILHVWKERQNRMKAREKNVFALRVTLLQHVINVCQVFGATQALDAKVYNIGFSIKGLL